MSGGIASKIGSRVSVYGRPTHAGIIARDYAGISESPHENALHLQAAIDWLCRAQDAVDGGGVSGGYYFHRGWQPPYPETTGYIIPTFLDYAALTDDYRYIGRATRMGDWEIAIQLDSGAVRGGVGVNDYPIVFNTGQVILGWCALYRTTGEQRFLDAAQRAGNWLVSNQDEDGKWSRHTYLDRPHVYHTRVAWPLLELWKATRNDRYRKSAERFLNWALTNATGNGWFHKMAFAEGEVPLTHTIAYSLRGFLESALLLDGEWEEKLLNIIGTAAEKLLLCYERRKKDPYGVPEYLAARFDENWKPAADYSCLTGNCQIALIWLKLCALSGDGRLLNGALKLIDQVKATQHLRSSNDGIRGGIAGSFPIWGGYVAHAYPNWPPKFFADALMLAESILAPMETAQA